MIQRAISAAMTMTPTRRRYALVALNAAAIVLNVAGNTMLPPGRLDWLSWIVVGVSATYVVNLLFYEHSLRRYRRELAEISAGMKQSMEAHFDEAARTLAARLKADLSAQGIDADVEIDADADVDAEIEHHITRH